MGAPAANKILAETGINPDTRVKDLTEDEEAKLREVIAHSYTVEGDLRRDLAMDIKRLTEIRLLPGRAASHAACLSGASGPRQTPVPARVPKRTVANKKK